MGTGSDHGSDSGTLPRLLETVTESVSQRPATALWVVALITLFSVVVTVRFLTFKTNRADLIDPKTEFHQRWLDYTSKFGDDSDVVIVVEADHELTVKNVINRVGQELDAEPDLFDRVIYRIDPGTIKSKALQYLSPRELEQANARLEMYSPILEGHWSRAGLESYALRLTDFIQQASRNGTPGELEDAVLQAGRLCSSLQSFLLDPTDFNSPWPEVVAPSSLGDESAFAARYQLAASGKMGFILATPRNASSDFSGSSQSLVRLQEICQEAQTEYEGVSIGMTGIPVLEADEMRRSQEDMLKASLISFVGVGLILLIGFRGFRHPFLALAMLAVGLAWALGFTTLVIGHLNILSVSFAAILIGLGIDFAIHYLARYIELRHHNEQFHRSLALTSQSVGTGIVTAAVTTALAFFCATFTNFLGVAELGIIAGGGILLCGIATFTVLPALVTLADSQMEPRQLPTPFQGIILRRLTKKYPGLVTFTTLIAIFAIGAQGFRYEDGQISSKVQYDANLLNLQAEGVESVELQKRIFKETNGSLLYAVSIADSIPEVRIRKEEFLALPTVSHVEEMASYMPHFPSSETNLLVQAMHARLSRLSDLPREFPQLDPLSIGQSIERLYESLAELKQPSAQQAASELDSFLDNLTRLELPEQMQILAGFQAAMLKSLHRQFQVLESMSNPEPVSPNDFLPGIRKRFVSENGHWLLRVYPTEQIWEEEPLAAFVGDVRTVDPEATGTPLQNYEAARQIQESYFNAAIYALIVISLILLVDALDPGPLVVALLTPLAVVAFLYSLRQGTDQEIGTLQLICLYVLLTMLVAFLLDFHNVRNALLTLLPPLAGGFLMFGVLGILGIDLNPANLVVLPLILGIGVDDGVHVIHDARHSKGRYETSPSIINAVTLTSLTSMVGFGSMIVAAHQGLASLGLVLVVGVGSCMFVSLVTLPAILSLFDPHRRQPASETEAEPERSTGESEVVSIRLKRKSTGVA